MSEFRSDSLRTSSQTIAARLRARRAEALSPVPGHIRSAGPNAGMFCSTEGMLARGGRCPEGCDHAAHYSNDGHPEREDASGVRR